MSQESKRRKFGENGSPLKPAAPPRVEGQGPSTSNKASKAVEEVFFDSSELSDIILECEGVSFFAHRIILAVASPVFRAMFQAPMKETREKYATINDMKKDVFAKVLKWCYAKKLDESETDLDALLELYKAAHFYEIEGLKTQCVDTIINLLTKPIMALEIYTFATLYEEARLQEKVMEMLRQHRAAILYDPIIFKEAVSQYPELIWQICIKEYVPPQTKKATFGGNYGNAVARAHNEVYLYNPGNAHRGGEDVIEL